MAALIVLAAVALALNVVALLRLRRRTRSIAADASRAAATAAGTARTVEETLRRLEQVGAIATTLHAVPTPAPRTQRITAVRVADALRAQAGGAR